MIKMRKEAITFEIFNKILFGLYRNVNEKILNRFYIKCNLNPIIFNCIQKKKKKKIVKMRKEAITFEIFNKILF